MNKWICIGRRITGLTGYATYEVLGTFPLTEGLKRLEGKKIIERFPSCFDSSVEIVIIE